MRIRIMIAALLAIALDFMPLAVTAAQSWEVKEWLGTIETPRVSKVSFKVDGDGNMEMNWHGQHKFKNLVPQEVTGATEKLVFDLELPNSSIYKCTLTKASSGSKFEGNCVSKNSKWKLSMSPKK